MNGFCWAWGDNKYGQLGNDTNDPCTTAVAVVGLNGEGYLENIIAISAGFWHSLAIDVDGTIWTWGKGDYGRLGLGDTVHRNTPHPIRVVYNITQQTFYFKIQDAIDDANNDDVIVASPGTYYENIDFLDKSITVRSTDPNYSDVVANTIIDGSNNDSNYVVTFDDNSGSRLAGFTITNGYYGGIRCGNQSSANITNCRIQNNTGYYGYGIALDHSSPNITNCRIRNNDYYGIYCWDNSDPNIIDCTIQDNVNGGIYCNNSHPNITNCLITKNGNENSNGGGIYNYNSSSPTITDCNISINSATRGGGIRNDSSDPNVNNCIFTGNTAVYYGGGIYNRNDSSATVANCVFRANSSDYAGGGMANYQSSLTLINCTFRRNFAYDKTPYEGGYGGGMYNYESSPNVTNCIFWGNEADSDGSEIYNYDDDSDPNFSYCDIEDSNGTGDNWHRKLGIDGDGNIDSDPLFYDSNDPNDYHLSSDSPCIDAGDPNFDPDPNETDIDGEPRIINGRVDIGADEFDDRDADFNNDGTVNFLDYAMFANVWQTENPDFSLDDDNDVDMNDLALFVEDWLWQAGWTKTFAVGCTQSMGRGFGLMEGLYPSAPAKQQPTQIKPLDIEYIIKWLDELWLTDEQVRKVIDEDKWLKFMELLKEQI